MADSDKSTTSEEDILSQARDAFERAEDVESHNRQNWIDDVRFARLGEQWPEAIRRQRELDGRPCLTINRLPSFIRQVTNDARQNSPSIKFHAVGDGADEQTAKVLDGLTRNIEYTSNADVAYDNALENAVTGGFGYFRISTDYADDDAFDQDICIEPVNNPLTVYGDPDCMDSDSAKWNVAFLTEMMPTDEFKRRWPDAAESNFEANDHNDQPGWFQDKQIRVAEYWTREEKPATLLRLSSGGVMYKEEYAKIKDDLDQAGITIESTRPTRTHVVTQRIITGVEVLETNAWAGKYIPIVPVYGDSVIVDGKRHLLSLVRFAKDPQQMFNYWRTASTELVAMAPKTPFIGAVGQFATDANKWSTANTETHAYLEYDQVDANGAPAPPPQRQQFAGPPAGALQEAANASDDMKTVMGLYDASLGAKSNETSGVAITARQREGDVSTFNFIDNQSRAIRHAGRIIADLIPKVYNKARIIRVIGEDGTNQNVPINGAPMQSPQAASQQPGAIPGGPGQAPQPMSPQPMSPQEQGIQGVFDLTAGKYDVTVEAGPSYTTQREESAAQMMQFITAYPEAGPLIGDLLAKNLDWKGADEIAERLKAMLPPQLQGQNPQVQQMQQQMQQMQQALQQAQQQLQQAQQAVNDKNTGHALEAQKVQVDLHKAQTDAYNAETNRLKVVGPAFGPDQISAIVRQTLQQVLPSPSPTGEASPPIQMPAPEPGATLQPQPQGAT